ncbi:MAG: SHOCT domain-containing protein, partial [Pyramidobacter sp.]|nr:SHOCT domain-containing protein [Pyramidobacter sp.]
VVNDPGKKSGRLKRAAIGTLLLGPAGLAAAAFARDDAVYTVVVDFLKGTRSTIEIDTKRYKAICQSCPDLEITDELAEDRTSAQIPQTDTATELMKYKQLLDNQVITQEEFDIKKKQLLGL